MLKGRLELFKNIFIGNANDLETLRRQVLISRLIPLFLLFNLMDATIKLNDYSLTPAQFAALLDALPAAREICGDPAAARPIVEAERSFLR